MKKLYLPLFLALLAPCFAQQDPEEIVTDFGIDEFIYVPKSTLNFGVRYMTGAKVSFGGKGHIGSFAESGDATTANSNRGYTNGSYVYADGRSTSTTAADGTVTTTYNNGADGLTNTWHYVDASQVTPEGNIAMKSYTADTADLGTQQKNPGAGTGVELVVTKDFGKLFGTPIRWGFTSGVSLNDIHSSIKERQVLADITTLTDVYSLNGQTPPDAGYSAPSQVAQTTTDTDGNVTTVLDADGNIVYTDTTVLINNLPSSRDISTTSGQAGFVNSSLILKGNYYTVRAGPTFYIPITEHLRASISVGGAMIYSGTNFRVVNVFTPEDGLSITQDINSDEAKVLWGYYVDASMEYTFTEATGLYLGAVYQTSGSYDQSVTDTTGGNSLYTTHVDLKQLQGVRAGMSFRF